MKNFTITLAILLFTTINAYPQWERTSGPEGNSIQSLDNINGKLYAGTGSDGLYVSTDAGLSWSPRNSGIEYTDVRKVITSSGNLIVGTASGVYLSTDDGQSWTQTGSFPARDLAVKDNFVFAASSGVYRSTDNGLTWQITDLFQGFFWSVTVSDNTILAGSSSIHRSTNNGDTWERLTGFLAKPNFSMFSKGDTIFIGRRNEILISYDNGFNYEVVEIPIEFDIFNIYDFTSVGSTLYMGTSYNGVYKSTNSGINWSPVIEGMGPKDIRAVTSTGSTLIAGAHYSGMYRSTNNAASWNKANNGFLAASTIDEIFSDGEFVYAGTRDGLYITDDQGDTWVKLTGENDTINYGTVSGICIKDGTLFAAARYQFTSSIFKWENQNWINIHNNLPHLTFVFGMAASGDNLLAGTSDGVYYSTNDGESWILTNLDRSIDDINSAGNGLVYANVTIDGIYRSNNNGISWSPNLLLSSIIDLSSEDNYAYATSFDDRLWITTSSGNAWLNASFGDATFGVEYLGNGTVLVSTDVENTPIYISTNFGFNFTPFSGGLNPSSVAEYFTADDTYMYCGMDYNGVWRALRPGVTSIDPEITIPENYSLSQNYPNPFNPVTKIEYAIPEESAVILAVYDILGREIVTLVNEVQQAGSYSVNFDGSQFSSGIYFYRINAGDFTKIKKMQLVK